MKRREIIPCKNLQERKQESTPRQPTPTSKKNLAPTHTQAGKHRLLEMPQSQSANYISETLFSINNISKVFYFLICFMGICIRTYQVTHKKCLGRKNSWLKAIEATFTRIIAENKVNMIILKYTDNNKKNRPNNRILISKISGSTKITFSVWELKTWSVWNINKPTS